MKRDCKFKKKMDSAIIVKELYTRSLAHVFVCPVPEKETLGSKQPVGRKRPGRLIKTMKAH